MRQLPGDSALVRAMYPKTWEWSLTPQILALLFNATIGKPGALKPPNEAGEGGTVITGSGPVSIDEFEKFWNDGAEGGG